MTYYKSWKRYISICHFRGLMRLHIVEFYLSNSFDSFDWILLEDTTPSQVLIDVLIKVAKKLAESWHIYFDYSHSGFLPIFIIISNTHLIFVCMGISANLPSFRSLCTRKWIISLFHPFDWFLLLHIYFWVVPDLFWDSLPFLNFFYRRIT